MARAIEHELERQAARLSAGQLIIQETLGWDEARQVTVSQRGKEEAQDYRYFPEPDLPPLVVDPGWVDEVRRSLPELPNAKRARLLSAYGLTPYAADVLTADPDVAAYFEAAVQSRPDLPPDKLANWLSGELFSLFNQSGQAFSPDRVPPTHLAELLGLIELGTINATTAKDVLARGFETGQSPQAIVEAEGLAQLSDAAGLQEIIQQVLSEHPDQVALYQGGKLTVAQWFFGQVMRATSGQANPQVVRQELDRALKALPASSGELHP